MTRPKSIPIISYQKRVEDAILRNVGHSRSRDGDMRCDANGGDRDRVSLDAASGGSCASRRRGLTP